MIKIFETYNNEKNKSEFFNKINNIINPHNYFIVERWANSIIYYINYNSFYNEYKKQSIESFKIYTDFNYITKFIDFNKYYTEVNPKIDDIKKYFTLYYIQNNDIIKDAFNDDNIVQLLKIPILNIKDFNKLFLKYFNNNYEYANHIEKYLTEYTKNKLNLEVFKNAKNFDLI